MTEEQLVQLRIIVLDCMAKGDWDHMVESGERYESIVTPTVVLKLLDEISRLREALASISTATQ